MARYNAYLECIDQEAFVGDRTTSNHLIISHVSQLTFSFDNGEMLTLDNGEIFHVLVEGKKVVDSQVSEGKL